MAQSGSMVSFNQRAYVYVLIFERKPVGVDLLEVEQLARKVEQPLGVLPRNFQIVLHAAVVYPYLSMASSGASISVSGVRISWATSVKKFTLF